MRENFVLITFILLLPVLAIIGHDLYITYGADEEKVEQLKELEVNPNEFSFSGVGRLWISYAPDSFNAVRKNISPDAWKNFMAPFIELPAVALAGFPLAIFLLLSAVLWVLGLGPYRRTPKLGGGTATAMTERDVSKKKTYKRK